MTHMALVNVIFYLSTSISWRVSGLIAHAWPPAEERINTEVKEYHKSHTNKIKQAIKLSVTKCWHMASIATHNQIQVTNRILFRESQLHLLIRFYVCASISERYYNYLYIFKNCNQAVQDWYFLVEDGTIKTRREASRWRRKQTKVAGYLLSDEGIWQRKSYH